LYPQRRGGAAQPAVVAGEPDGLSKRPQVLDRSKMERVESPDRGREGIDGPGKHLRSQFEESHASEQLADGIAMRTSKAAAVDTCPELILEEATGDHRLLPKFRRRLAVLGEQLREGHRGVEIDQRSARSRSSSASSSLSGARGVRGGGPEPPTAGLRLP